ncbi:MAG TPA: serine O-acetyltransferase [Verrucomicrobiae bacterium]
MIRSKDDLLNYLAADRKALGSPKGLKYWLLFEPWKIQVMLRWAEYHKNSGHRLRALLSNFRFQRYSHRYGMVIHLNVFGPGLSIAHPGMIIVNEAARVGANCRIHPGTVIGTAAGQSKAAPQIGDNVYIGPGAKIFGAIRIGNNVAIGANAVVNKDVPDNVTVGGIPAKVISERNSESLLIEGVEA